jgi:hypothetical protein
MALADELNKTETEAKQGTLTRREFLKLAGIALSLANPLIGYGGQETEGQEQAQPARQKTVDFPIWYKVGDLGYAENKDAYLIRLNQVVSRTIKEGDALEKWWVMEGQDSAQKRLYQIIFLTINKPSFYPRDFSRYYNLKEGASCCRRAKKPISLT